MTGVARWWVVLCVLGMAACGHEARERALSVELDSSGVEPAVLSQVSSWEVEWSAAADGTSRRTGWQEGERIPFSVSEGDRLIFTGKDSSGLVILRGEGTVPKEGTLRVSLALLPVP